jgi:N-methylhydantoinase B
MSDIDPITLSVIQAGLQQVCDEMDLTFSRSAFSPVIAEANDRSDGIYDAENWACRSSSAPCSFPP